MDTVNTPALDYSQYPDADGHFRRRYGVLASGGAYLLRPDQHVCARWRRPDEAGVRAALQRACGAAATA